MTTALAAPEPGSSGSTDKAARSPLARRRRTVVVTAVLAAVISTAGLGASTLVKSPAQLAAETEPPEPSVLTAEVVRKKLSATVVMRGKFTAGRRQSFTPTSAAASAHGPAASVLVVTAVKTRLGARATAGQVLLEVSERPIVALPGDFPAYRDMAPGMTGKDVGQLRAALARLGFPSHDRPGYFGASTKAAVRRFYAHIGYPVPLARPAAQDGNPTSPRQDAPAEGGAGAARPPADPDPIVPMSEVAFLPTLPARVAALSTGVGGTVRNPLITFATGRISLTARLDPQNGSLVEVGMRASVVSEATGFTGTATVSAIGEATTDHAGSDGSTSTTYLPVRIVRDARWPARLASQDVRVTVTRASTEQAVLAVPQAALSSTADGRTWVTVVTDDRAQRAVDVAVGVSADGMVEVSSPSGELKAGDRVVTGR